MLIYTTLDRDADLDVPGWREQEADHLRVRHPGAAHPRRERPRAFLRPPGPEHHLIRQPDLAQSRQLSRIKYMLWCDNCIQKKQSHYEV